MTARVLGYASAQAPRYTSYPAAPHFSSQIGDAEVRSWLGSIRDEDRLSLYIHVPYCRQLCWYCGCNTYSARRDEPIIDFVDTLLHEIDVVAAALGGNRVVEIHWGGGTPNILEPEQFERVAGAIAGRFDLEKRAQHALEIDPRYLDEAKVAAYARWGVNRASLGVQDLNENVQRAMGRVQPLEQVQRAIALLRGAGIAEINMDLMYGLPQQSVEDLIRSVRLASAMQPNRLALFGYAHVPWFKKRQRLIAEAALPSINDRFHQAAAARAELVAQGYVAIGLDHFALPSDPLAQARRTGALHRSFQGYVVNTANAIVGLGPSAISTFPQGYAQNASEPGAWARPIHQNSLATARGHMLTRDDRVRGAIIEDIMCRFEADLAPLGGAAACAAELEALSPMFEDELLSLEGDLLQLREAAHPLCRVVAMAFDAYAPRAAARHSCAV